MKNSIKLILGDSLKGLQSLPANSVHCLITSPPYWGLRDYEVAGQMGSEPTFTWFLDNMVKLFHEANRVLHPSGTLWLNMGDSYNSALTRGAYGDQSKKGYTTHGSARSAVKDLHSKSLLGQPWRLAFALQNDGWILRDDIIWYKSNPMPSSVEDRTTKSHEYLFLFSKRPRYFFNSFAIREPAKDFHPSGTLKYREVWEEQKPTKNDGLPKRVAFDTRNKHSVWIIPTEPFPEAHCATFPTKLVEPCILAGTSSKGCCPACLAPWLPVKVKVGSENYGKRRKRASTPGAEVSETSTFATGDVARYEIASWHQGCKCPTAEPIPCTVLDIFSGSGTTGVVAARWQRNYIGIELNPKYLEMSRRRIYDDQPLLNDVEVVA